MPIPSTAAEFLEVVRKSGVLEPRRFDTYLERQREAGTLPSQPGPLADTLIADGLITRFQANQLLQGKWRNFLISGKYKVLERLGAGGMGTVFLCEHKVMQRLVALK